MVEEALSGPTPLVDSHPGLGVKTQTPIEHPAAAKKSAASNTAGRTAGRQQRLVSHLLIGFLMAVIAIAGYAFLGPDAHASAADLAGNNLVDVTTNAPLSTPAVPAIYENNQMGDLAAMQAEMDEITRRINALQAANMPASQAPNAVGSAADSSLSGSRPDQMIARLDQMTTMLNDLTARMNAVNPQAGGMSTPASGAGHAGHH